MEPFDHITVRRDDGKWIAYLIVVMCERNYAKVQLDRVIELLVNAEVPSGSVKNRIDFKGAHIKWCVVRNSDSQILQQGLKSAAEAADWMRNFEKAQ
jgi:hypothetical protein